MISLRTGRHLGYLRSERRARYRDRHLMSLLPAVTMFKPWLLRLHRWLTLVFAVPLALVMVTGLILSFEPVAQVSSLKPGSVTTEQVLSLLQRHDPAGQARSLTLRSYEDRLAIGGARPGDTV